MCIHLGMISKIKTWQQLKDAVKAGSYVRWSKYPRKDEARGYSVDHATGQRHAGLSVNTIDAGDDPVTVASRVIEYGFAGPVCSLWSGRVAGKDTDGAEVIADAKLTAIIDASLITRIKDAYVLDREIRQGPVWVATLKIYKLDESKLV